MGVWPVPKKIKLGQAFGDNPTKDLPTSHWLIKKFGNYQPNGHSGHDFPGAEGTPIYAIDDGVVMWADEGTKLPGDNSATGWASRWYLDKPHTGRTVAIEHTAMGGFTSIYSHLKSWAVKPFQKVKAGQLIGHMGSTGRVTGTHLHLDVVPHTYAWTNGFYGRVDPTPYISGGPAQAPPKTTTPPAVKPAVLERRNGMIWLTDLAHQLRAQGLTVVEVPGWKTRGYSGYGFHGVGGVLHHHTATGRAAFARSNMPTLNLLTHGRSDLAGPLCNIAFGRDGTVYVVAAGWANHAGRGSAPGFPRDQGNGWLIGIEAESSGVAPWDWTKDQLRVWPYLAAALEKSYLAARAAHLRLQLGHKEYSSEGKIDPAGIDMNTFRASINKIRSSGGKTAAPAKNTKTKDWFDMATEADLRRIVREEIKKNLRHAEFEDINGKKQTLNQIWVFRTRKAERLLDAIAEAVKPSRLALTLWGYTGKTAHKFANGKAMDAYATLNETLRHVDSAKAGSTNSKETK